MTWSVPSLAGLTLLTLAAAAFARQDSPPPDNRAFQPTARFEKNQTSRYQTQSSWTMQFKARDGTSANLNLSSAMDTILRYRVRETKSDGSTVLSVLLEGGKRIDASNVMETLPREPDSYPRTVSLDRHAKITALKDPKAAQKNPLDGLLSQSNLFVPLHFLPLPENPVKIGDTWKARYPLPNAKADSRKPADKTAESPDDPGDTTAIRVTLTLLGVERIDQIDTLVVKQELTVPYELPVDAQGKATEPGKATGHIRVQITFVQQANLLPTDGRLLRSQGQIGGWIRFEGTIASQVPTDTMKIEGSLITVRLAENTDRAKTEKEKR